MKRSHGSYSKRSRNFAGKGKETIRERMSSYKNGEHVRISASPATKSGRPFLRFNGLIGTIEGKQGFAYCVAVNDGNKRKHLVVTNRHLARL